MRNKLYTIDYVIEKENGSHERVETVRNTEEGLETLLESLRNDPNCVTFGVSEKTFGSELWI